VSNALDRSQVFRTLSQVCQINTPLWHILDVLLEWELATTLVLVQVNCAYWNSIMPLH